MAVLVLLALFLSLTGYSSAAYCLCKDGGSDVAYQRAIDYACGNGADCRPILQNGPCFQPNTVKAHCDYAVNSYFQNKGQTADSCNFAGTATSFPNPPTTVVAGCTYPASPGQTSGVPSTTPGTSTGTGTGTGTGIGTGTGTPTGTTTGLPGSTPPGVFSPVGVSPLGSTDPNYTGSPSLQLYPGNLFSLSVALCVPYFLVLWG